ncbi:GTP cyclohydrolase II [Neophaeococcomyces mojaviensis]|uniref:GTP cyclohydrolase II n=1 Tax=Neophaeococcomyces mojaviensis TaxID=3383035 RepID=A0ACC3A526_9EURO|nr:GTP cyclohydrolase II [Knufia sp. JES_112]
MTTTNELPSHGSPLISPLPRPSAQYLSGWADLDNTSQPGTPGIPHNLISPAYTPPLTPSIPGTPSATHHRQHEPKSIPVDTDLDDPITTKQPRLLQRLPNVECLVRARIPTTSGAEMFLHLYQNDSDNKEHLAIVFGNSIRSRSLDAEKPGETEMDRMIRGAYVGRLRPGRTSSRRDEDDLRRKVLRSDVKGRPRSGSALRNVQTVPEDAAIETSSSTPPHIFQPRQDEQNAELTHLTSTPQPHPSPSTIAASTPDPSQLDLDLLKPPLVRIHSECYTGETAWSARCDCGEQLDEAARLMSTVSATNPDPASIGGVIVYLRQEGRGIGLASKLKAYNLQDLGNDTVEANLLLRHPADARTYGLATAILQDLGLGTDEDEKKDEKCRGIRLLTNNPDKVRAVEGPNKEVRVVERVAMVPLAWRSGGREGVKGVEIEKYLETKIGRMGHMLEH